MPQETVGTPAASLALAPSSSQRRRLLATSTGSVSAAYLISTDAGHMSSIMVALNAAFKNGQYTQALQQQGGSSLQACMGVVEVRALRGVLGDLGYKAFS